MHSVKQKKLSGFSGKKRAHILFKINFVKRKKKKGVTKRG